VLSGAETKAELAMQFERDLEDSREISADEHTRRPCWQRWLAHIVLLARRWI